MATINSSIAGLFKYPEAKEIMKGMEQGAAFAFEAEPTNPYDPNAIALFVMGASNTVRFESGEGMATADLRKIKCGYVPAVLAKTLTVNRISAIVKGAKFDSIIITTTEESNAE